MQTIVSIPGMHCDGCKALIQDVSLDFPAIQKTNVDLETKKVILEHDGSLNIDTWKKEVEDLGDAYKVAILSA